jgi:hypothetical protein
MMLARALRPRAGALLGGFVILAITATIAAAPASAACSSPCCSQITVG